MAIIDPAAAVRLQQVQCNRLVDATSSSRFALNNAFAQENNGPRSQLSLYLLRVLD
jgi:hypothetical protein